jgi:hypothetical protein
MPSPCIPIQVIFGEQNKRLGNEGVKSYGENGGFICSGNHALFVLDFAKEAGERRNLSLYIVLLNFRS